MKNTFFSFLAGLSLALAVQPCLATGSVGLDPVQTGTINFTAATGLTVTNSFPFAYTVAPYMLLVGSTNTQPITNVLTTTTNFAVGITNNTTITNGTVTWTAFVGYPRIVTGTNAIQANTTITNSFGITFALPPVVTLGSGATNGSGGIPCVTNITTTNFNILLPGNAAGTNQILQWMAVGGAAAPGSYNPNFPSVTF